MPVHESLEFEFHACVRGGALVRDRWCSWNSNNEKLNAFEAKHDRRTTVLRGRSLSGHPLYEVALKDGALCRGLKLVKGTFEKILTDEKLGYIEERYRRRRGKCGSRRVGVPEGSCRTCEELIVRLRNSGTRAAGSGHTR